MLVYQKLVSKLFRAYGLYNGKEVSMLRTEYLAFQSSFELTGYITKGFVICGKVKEEFQSSFELTGYITIKNVSIMHWCLYSFKALSSLRVI